MEGIGSGEGASGARDDRMPERQHFPEYAQASLLGEAYPVFLTFSSTGGNIQSSQRKLWQNSSSLPPHIFRNSPLGLQIECVSYIIYILVFLLSRRTLIFFGVSVCPGKYFHLPRLPCSQG